MRACSHRSQLACLGAKSCVCPVADPAIMPCRIDHADHPMRDGDARWARATRTHARTSHLPDANDRILARALPGRRESIISHMQSNKSNLFSRATSILSNPCTRFMSAHQPSKLHVPHADMIRLCRAHAGMTTSCSSLPALVFREHELSAHAARARSPDVRV